MDLFDVVRASFRRWYVVLPLLLVAAWFAHDAYTSVKPVYYSSAVVGIAPPNSRLDQAELGVPVPQNGLLVSGGPALVANLLVFGLREPSVVGQVVAAGGDSNYTVRMFPTAAGSPDLPLVMIEATEPDPVAASTTVALAAAQAEPALHALQQQSGAPDDQMANALLASPPSPPAAGVPSRTRSTIVIAAAGAGIAILVGLMFDLLITRWKSRRQRQTQVEDANAEQTAEAVNGKDRDSALTHKASRSNEDASGGNDEPA